MKVFDELKAKVAIIEKDVIACEKGNKAAGTRVRVAMQEIKGLAHEVRNEVTKLKEAVK